MYPQDWATSEGDRARVQEQRASVMVIYSRDVERGSACGLQRAKAMGTHETASLTQLDGYERMQCALQIWGGVIVEGFCNPGGK